MDNLLFHRVYISRIKELREAKYYQQVKIMYGNGHMIDLQRKKSKEI